jgi:hypothetical protein
VADGAWFGAEAQHLPLHRAHDLLTMQQACHLRGRSGTSDAEVTNA